MTVPLLLSIIHECISDFSFDQATFNQITKFFNLILDSPYDPNPLNTIQQKFQNKLFDIFHTEGSNYKDYLMLPRFNSLKPSTQDKLKTLFNTIWHEYQRKLSHDQSISIAKQLQKILPDFKTLDDVQTFHIDLFNCFKTFRTNKENTQTQNHPFPFPSKSTMPSEMRYKRPHESSFFMMDQHSKFNTFPTINSHTKGFFPKIQDDPKYNQPIWPDDKYAENLSSFPINNKIPTPYQNNIFANNQIQKPNHQKLNSQQILERPNFTSGSPPNEISVENVPQTNHIAINDEDLQSRINSFMFVECACEGNLQKPSAPFMVCKNCLFYFHHECLLITNDAKADLCPCCRLKEGSNIFIKIHQEAFGKRWCKNMKSQKLSLFLTEREIQKLKAEKMACTDPSQIEYQLRFLKLTKRIRKDKDNARQPFENINRRFNNIQLPKNFIEKLQPYNQLQIGLKPTEQDKEDECVYLFGIFLAQKFSQRYLVDQLFNNLNETNSVDESFIRQFMIPGQQFVEIKMKDPNNQRSIAYPSRGNRCQHPDVFDYLSLLEYYKEYGDKLSKKHCPICEMEVESVIADRFLLEKISGFQEDVEKDFELIRYFGDGRVEFAQDQDEIDSSENENEQQNQEDEENSSESSSGS